MLELPHVLVGTFISYRLSASPLLALPLSLTSHFILDALPHWNPHLSRKNNRSHLYPMSTWLILVADSLASLLISGYFALRHPHPWLVFISAGLAALPDIVEIPFFFLSWQPAWLSALVRWQKSLQFDVPALPGLIIQFLLCLYLWLQLI